MKVKPQHKHELAQERETCINAQIQENCWRWRRIQEPWELCEEAQTFHSASDGAQGSECPHPSFQVTPPQSPLSGMWLRAGAASGSPSDPCRVSVTKDDLAVKDPGEASSACQSPELQADAPPPAAALVLPFNSCCSVSTFPGALSVFSVVPSTFCVMRASSWGCRGSAVAWRNTATRP